MACLKICHVGRWPTCSLQLHLMMTPLLFVTISAYSLRWKSVLVVKTWCSRTGNGNIDSWRWHCNGRDCRRAERLRSGSIFAGLRLSLQQLVHLMYFYSIGYTKQADLMFQLDINSQHSITEWKCHIRDVFAQYFITHPQTVGGFGHTVEIDECLLVRWKYNIGHRVEQQWVFGGVDLDTTMCSWFLLRTEQLTLCCQSSSSSFSLAHALCQTCGVLMVVDESPSGVSASDS